MRRALLLPGLLSSLWLAGCLPDRAPEVDPGTVPDEDPPDIVPPGAPPSSGPEVCRLTETDRALGSGALLRREVRTLNEWGDEVQTRYDDDGDGDFDHLVHREFDNNGRVTLVETDLDLDGAFDRSERFSYELGQLVERRVDTDGDGFPDEIFLWAWAEDGQLTMYTADLDGDFLPDYDERRQYDPEGRLTLHTVDRDGDGVVDERRTRGWDEDGAIFAEDDLDADGTPERRLTRLSLPPGRVELEELDADDDGAPETVRERRYDPRDRLRVVREEGPAGVEHRFFEWTAGRPRLVTIVPEDGPRGEHRYRYDGEGRLTSERLDLELDGEAELERSYTFDGDDELIASHEAERGPAGLRREVTVSTGPEGRVERAAFDLDGDGALDLRTLRQWAPNEAEAWLELHDDDGDGAFDRRVVRVLSCGPAQPE